MLCSNDISKRFHKSYDFPALAASQMQAHQTIGIVEGDFSDRGTARVRQVGVTVVDRQSTETYERVQRIIQAAHYYLLQ